MCLSFLNDKGPTLDDRIFCLLRTPGLDSLQRTKLFCADVHYVQDRDKEAEAIVIEIEEECRRMSIQIWRPMWA